MVKEEVRAVSLKPCYSYRHNGMGFDEASVRTLVTSMSVIGVTFISIKKYNLTEFIFCDNATPKGF